MTTALCINIQPIVSHCERKRVWERGGGPALARAEVMNRLLAPSEIFLLEALVPRFRRAFPLAQYNSFQVHHNFICTISPFHEADSSPPLKGRDRVQASEQGTT